MKKLLLTLFAVFIISANAMAFNIYIDAYGAYVGCESAENQLGGGGGLFFGINKNFSLGMKFNQTFMLTYDRERFTSNYSDMMFNGGLEYNLQLGETPLFWSSYAGLGIERIDIRKQRQAGGELNFSEMGFAFAVMTGIRWDFHSHIALFGYVGFHMPFFANGTIPNPSAFPPTYFGGLKDWTVYGLTAQIGVRFAIWNNKPIDEQY